jgi:5'-methylthioadenosine phosphorylase
MASGRIGIIGGSGFYALPGLKVLEEVALTTPWGAPSSSLLRAELCEREVVFLARHGIGHRFLPHEVNYRANIAALKQLGVGEVVAFSAVGSLREELRPLEFAVPDQLLDRTRSRRSTFFGDGVAGHVAFADPYCTRLQDVIDSAGVELGLTVHRGETLVCIEGPTFSTRAESKLFRSWGAGLINMSALPEARLAREAELCYALVCMITDYDCWRTSTEDVDIGSILANLRQNADNAARLVAAVVERHTGDRPCACSRACEAAIITAPEARNPAQEERLRYVLPERFTTESSEQAP